ncbi:hypothetical protein FRB94_009861 [Tulasnella sp. JGI-2019a]|nr:hypothetical protein FRB93_013752 [Tulasnella sp. JGI-2019a]KAG9010780.1 hypothetical protein FRB94_009861 [Tulasnella sp. JGI-2019a]
MRFFTLATLSALSIAVQAIYIPTAGQSFEVARRNQDVAARCDSCGISSGGSSGGSTSTTVGLGLTLGFSNPGQLNCLTSAVNVLATYGASLTAVAKAEVLTSVAIIATFTAVEVATLDAALVALKTSGTSLASSTYVAICAKAHITLSITAAEIDCLRAYISTTLAADYSITVAEEVAVYNWCNNVVSYTTTQLTSLVADVVAVLHATISTGTSVGTSTGTTVAASLSGVIALRVKLLAYVHGLVGSADLLTKIKLVAIITEINLWIIGSVVTKADYNTCWNIMQQVSSCGYSTTSIDLSVFGSFNTHA